MAKSTTSLTSESTKVVERKTRRKPGPGSGEPQDQPASTPSVPAKPDEVDLFTFHPVKWHDGENAEMRIEPRNADSVRQTFGSESPAINTALLKQIMFFQSIEEATSHMDKRAFAAAIVREIEPRDAFERMLAAEMVATHTALMRQARSLAEAASPETNTAYVNGHNKLARTNTAQMEAIRKHRNGGQQTVTVQHQHVNVEDVGQAIVGNVTRGEGNGNK